MNKRILFIMLALGLILLFSVAALADVADDYGLDWWVIASGGSAEGDGYTLDSAIGQPMTGASSAGGYELYSGYLSGELEESPQLYLPLIQAPPQS